MNIFDKSIELAKADFDSESPCRCQVFSFAWYKGHILGIGKNGLKTHPLNLRNVLRFSDGKVHHGKGVCSELRLFIKIRNTTNIKFNKITVVNVRLNKQMEVCYSRPCSSCASLVKFIQPKYLYYSDDVGNFELYE